MKKILVSAFAATAAAAVFAGMNNVIISFSTPGPDKYSDGTDVLAGEKYALVWTPSGETFSGVNADGKAAGGSKVVIAAPVATGGSCSHCPNVLFQVDEDYVKANYPDGTWSVCLLDTRVFELDEHGRPKLDGAGNRIVTVWGKNSSVVNGYGSVGAGKVVTGGVLGAAGGIAAASETPSADTPAPEIKDIAFDGDLVSVTITSTKPAFKYTLLSGNTPGEVTQAGDADFGSEKEDIILYSVKKPGGEFFKVNCK